jgi:putative ATP-dependent endonuclease of OLD family
VDFLGEHMIVHGRTLEETFIYENIQVFGEAGAFTNVALPTIAKELNKSMFELIRESNFKKTDFALTVLSSDDWQVPSYIGEGLKWLEQRLQNQNQVIEGPVI